jgi:hypothetical protein
MGTENRPTPATRPKVHLPIPEAMSYSGKNAWRGSGSKTRAATFRDLRRRNDRRARQTEAQRKGRSEEERVTRAQQERHFRLGG